MVQKGVKELILSLLILLASGCSSAPDFGGLSRLAQGKTDKMDTHGFTEIYEHMFSPLKSSPIKICEIGIGGGGSLKVWLEYFGKSTVFGIDVYNLNELRSILRRDGVKQDFLPPDPESGRLKTFVADQANRDQLKSFVDKYGGDFDIILDDGGHTMEQQQVSFGFFFKYVRPGRYYVIEDVHTSLVDRSVGAGVERDESNTTLTMINYFIRNGQIKSRYLTADEMEYLSKNIEYCNLFFRNNYAHSMTCIFKKKKEKWNQAG